MVEVVEEVVDEVTAAVTIGQAVVRLPLSIFLSMLYRPGTGQP